MSFERRLCNRRMEGESVFRGWHNQGIFAVKVDHRPDVYQLVPNRWYGSVEMPTIYPVTCTLLNIYFAGVTTKAVGVRQ